MQADLDAWLTFLRANGRSPNPNFAIRNLVLVRTLAARYDSAQSGSSATPAEREQREAQRVYRARETANTLLDKAVTREVVPSEAEIRAAFDAAPERYNKPKRWRLSNIFLRVDGDVPDAVADSRKHARAHLEKLRQQILDGADFSALARAESQSETRLRGGDLGFTALARLHPKVARAVSKLGVNDVSEVIETEDGVTLLRCTAILEPEQIDFASARKRVEARLREAGYQQAREALDDGLVAAMGLRIVPFEPTAGKTRTIEAHFNVGDEARTLTTEALTRYLRLYGVRKPIDAFSAEKRHTFIRDCVLHEARTREARRRGLLDDAAYEASLVFDDLEIRAQLVANRESAGKNLEPSEEAIAAFYKQRRDDLVESQARHLRMVAVSRDATYGADFYRALRASAARLAAARAQAAGSNLGTAASGGDTLEALAHELGERGELRDLGWLTDVQVWQLGHNVDAAMAELAVGQVTNLVQQGRELYVVELVAERPERQLSLDEARPRIRAALMTAERRRIGTALRQKVLEEQRIEEIEVGE